MTMWGVSHEQQYFLLWVKWQNLIDTFVIDFTVLLAAIYKLSKWQEKMMWSNIHYKNAKCVLLFNTFVNKIVRVSNYFGIIMRIFFFDIKNNFVTYRITNYMGN